jgi:hypothetical protein
LKVCEPRPNSGVLVLPITIAPAFLMRCTNSASEFATRSPTAGEPLLVGRPFGVAQVLDRDREALHPARRLAARERRVARIRLGQQLLRRAQRHDRVVQRIEPRDAREAGLHQLAAGDFARGDALRQRAGVQLQDGFGHSSSLLEARLVALAQLALEQLAAGFFGSASANTTALGS